KRRDFIIDLEGSFNSNIVGIYGDSGAGKSTLFSMITGLEKPDRGRIVLNDRVLVDTQKNIYIPPHKRNIGMVFQEKLLFPHLSIKENLIFGQKYAFVKKVNFEQVVEFLNIGHLLKSFPGNISGGEQQRVAIGRALLTSPELLLLDEPFNAVDERLRKQILPYIKNISTEFNIPILLISHDLPDIQKLTNTIYIVDKGECCGYGEIVNSKGFINVI
ncbi:MAG: ATP-binding cassette domain-containing protein, partial [Spirochaetales bacterium]|nr:ATP-binding cassette domain-containing protein [Spirochaetales bacterium]